MTKSIRSILTLGGSLVAVAGMTWIFFHETNKVVQDEPPHNLPRFPDEYQVAASVAKLERIGKAMLLYRESVGFKPVAERSNLSDAGLPVRGFEEAMLVTGKPWSIESDTFRPPPWNDSNLSMHRYQFVLQSYRSLSYSLPISYMTLPIQTQFVQIDDRRFLEPMAEFCFKDELSKLLKSRGDEIPVLTDLIPGKGQMLKNEPEEIIILRLNGKVEICKAPSRRMRDIAMIQ